MTTVASGGPGSGGNYGTREGRADDAASSFTGHDFFFFRTTREEDANRSWMCLSELGRQLGSVIAKLCRAEESIRAANFAIVAGQEGTTERRADAKARYDVAYEEYVAACARFVPKP